MVLETSSRIPRKCVYIGQIRSSYIMSNANIQ